MALAQVLKNHNTYQKQKKPIAFGIDLHLALFQFWNGIVLKKSGDFKCEGNIAKQTEYYISMLFEIERN